MSHCNCVKFSHHLSFKRGQKGLDRNTERTLVFLHHFHYGVLKTVIQSFPVRQRRTKRTVIRESLMKENLRSTIRYSSGLSYLSGVTFRRSVVILGSHLVGSGPWSVH